MLIKEVVRPRIIWRKGWIVDYIKGRDGKIRGVKLVIINSKSEKVQLSRPLQLIIPLEIISSKTNDIALKIQIRIKIQTRIKMKLLMKSEIRMM